jgi:chromosome segregation ATPase
MADEPWYMLALPRHTIDSSMADWREHVGALNGSFYSLAESVDAHTRTIQKMLARIEALSNELRERTEMLAIVSARLTDVEVELAKARGPRGRLAGPREDPPVEDSWSSPGF